MLIKNIFLKRRSRKQHINNETREVTGNSLIDCTTQNIFFFFIILKKKNPKKPNFNSQANLIEYQMKI